ncbi:hypothetical protein EMIT07CA2_40206 [Brevibacillus sp. IT-7CA2]
MIHTPLGKNENHHALVALVGLNHLIFHLFSVHGHTPLTFGRHEFIVEKRKNTRKKKEKEGSRVPLAAVIGYDRQHARIFYHTGMAKGAARALIKGKVISHPARTALVTARPYICFLFFDWNDCFF